MEFGNLRIERRVGQCVTIGDVSVKLTEIAGRRAYFSVHSKEAVRIVTQDYSRVRCKAVVSRKEGEHFLIGAYIEIQFRYLNSGGRAILGIIAPKDIKILRDNAIIKYIK